MHTFLHRKTRQPGAVLKEVSHGNAGTRWMQAGKAETISGAHSLRGRGDRARYQGDTQPKSLLPYRHHGEGVRETLRLFLWVWGQNIHPHYYVMTDRHD